MTKVWEIPILSIRLTSYFPIEREAMQGRQDLHGSLREGGTGPGEAGGTVGP